MSYQTNSNNDWIECVKWLNNLDILPIVLRQKFLTNQLKLNEFASFLRDGEFLCNLVNQIVPGCIDSTFINKRAQMSQILCLNNIRLFLAACKSERYFGMTNSDLFDEHMLYDLVDFACVIRTLSILSKNELTVKSTNINGFNIGNSSIGKSLKDDLSPRRLSSSGSQDSNQLVQINDDIYYNIVPAEVEGPESYYTDESFLFNGLSDQKEKTDNHVYQTIVSTPNNTHLNHQPLKRDFVMKEILNTEKNFLDGLNILMNDFLIPIGNVISEQDKNIIFTNMNGLIVLHSNLYNDLYNACKGGPGRTLRICNVFESYKVGLMKEYAEYFSSIDRARARVDSLMQVSLSNQSSEQTKEGYIRRFRTKLEECSSKSKFGKYKLTDLMGLPYQRVLKYHLLFSELLKQTDVDHTAKDAIKTTKDSMCELGNYLNECQRDKENLSKIEFFNKFLLNNSSNETTRTSLNLNLKDYGHYIKDDKFRIKSIDSGERYARTRTFFLFEKALIVCKSKGNFYNYKEKLLIDDFSIEDHYQSNLASQSSSNLPHGIISNLFNSSNLNSSANLSTSSHNLNSSANAHSLHLIGQDNKKKYLVIFKNKEHKKEWKECLLKAKEKTRPEGQEAFRHFFQLSNFDRELVKCFVCNKYLLGLFYQGYKCSECLLIAHKECLVKIAATCNSMSKPAPLISNKSVSNSAVTITRSLSTNSAKSNYSQSLLAKAIYNYDGRPAPPEGAALSFNQGDLIRVTDDDDDDWWKGIVVASNIEGYFLRRHVRVIQNQGLSHSLSSGHLSRNLNLEEYNWFSPVDRHMADAILSRIPNDISETIFMVRCRNDGGYAISIKHKNIVDHIKINISELGNSALAYPANIHDSAEDQDFVHVYSIDQQHSFNSIVSLIEYFSTHLLKDNFPQLDSTLGIPFKKALPPYISVAVAKHDYVPPNKENIGEQIELKFGKKYYILSKEINGWFKVFNGDGLIGYVPGSYLNEGKDFIES